MDAPPRSTVDTWPTLHLEAWADTCATLHRWLQIVGKIQLVQSAWVNHSWHTTLHVTARGLITPPVPHGTRVFQIAFDFLDHRLVIQAADGAQGGFALAPQSVARFYAQLMAEMSRLDLAVNIDKRPNELPDATCFDQDAAHAAYDAVYAQRFWRVLVQCDRVFRLFRSRFTGKCSPVHLFWGALDLALTRFSGRPAPPHPGGIPHLPDRVTREAYSHEVSSCGFWPGSGPIAYPAFYSYAYPEPAGFATANVQPSEAFYSSDLHEFILPYEVVRAASSPDAVLLAFLQTTYVAAADHGRWQRAALERT